MNNLVVVDTSGSMSEAGKRSALMYMLNTIKNMLEDKNMLEEPPEIYTWDSEIKAYSGKKIEFKAKNNADVFVNFLNEHAEQPVLFITDGCLSSQVRSAIKKHSENIICLMLGTDGSFTTLKRLLGCNNVFEASDTAACVFKYLSVKGGV